ncbi:MAG: hypothetical protein O3B00_08570 [archaeon]|jgi:hypothetical protein|nr:hypothetical protein [archaeon]MDA1131532.1 hypothetical protein [archaeon]
MAANLQAISFVIILLLIVPGCINSQEMSATGEEMEQETELPEKLNLIADTAGRDIDRGQQMDLLADADGEKTLILWVATGCSGCHDWTGMIADSMREGNISNDTRIISIHRYPSFESREQVIDVYASENSSTQSLWPVLIPDEGQSAIDMDTGQNTDYSYSTTFDSPVTPSFTLIDGDGKTLWRSKVYWANQTLLTEAIDLLDS